MVTRSAAAAMNAAQLHSAGRDLLVGGGGADHLIGNGGDDLLIAGFLRYADDFDYYYYYYPEAELAIAALMAEWGRTDLTTGQRIADLRAGVGAGGLSRIDETTITATP